MKAKSHYATPTLGGLALCGKTCQNLLNRWLKKGSKIGRIATVHEISPEFFTNSNMPKKIKELIQSLENAGFVNRGGKGSHRNFTHPALVKPVVISGNIGDDAKKYQERAVEAAIKEAKKCAENQVM